MSKKYNKKFGDFGEDLAADFLQKKGYEIIEKNLYNQYGEIDLICKKKDEIIFVEVKTRSSDSFGQAEEAVNFYKQKKLSATIEKYLMENEVNLTPVFEVVIVELPGIKPKFIHYQEVELLAGQDDL